MFRRDPSFCARGGNWSVQGIQNLDKQLEDYWNTINSDKVYINILKYEDVFRIAEHVETDALKYFEVI